MRFILLTAAMFAAGCSGSPTSPTPVAEARVSESRASQSPVGGAPDDGAPGGGTPSRPAIRWDVIAPGCSPQPAPSPLPDPNAAILSPEANGLTSATWQWTSAGRPVLLIAYFMEDGGMLKLCSWDTSDL
jgi:hypothetical protein